MKNILIVLFTLSCFLSKGQSITFPLDTTSNVSVGVFRQSDSVMYRTILAASSMNAGSQTVTWDGKDDSGVTISSPGPVYLKALVNNVQYRWLGVVGNSSATNTGTGVHRGYYTSMTGMAITGTTAFFCQGYSEAYSSQAKFNTANPQVRLDIFPGRVSTVNADFVATDGVNVYWSGYDPKAQSHSFISATRISDNAQVSFGGYGSTYKMINIGSPKTYTSVIDTTLSANSRPTGLAVNTNYIFSAHGGLNQLHVLNDSGRRVQNLTYTNPRYISLKNDTLWMVTATNTVGKYTINANGTLSSIGLSITAVSTPGATAVIGNEIAVIDQANQVLRFFNTVTGTEGTQVGTNGGYTTSPDVSNSKFMFNDYRGNTFSFVSVAPDGSFWLGDPGNYRQLHFSANKVFIEQIISQGQTYSTSVDPNNIHRVFGNYLEFNVNYSPSLTWTLVKNWGVNSATNVTTKKLVYVTTLSNGRTYAKDYDPGYGANGQLVELTATGLRNITSIGNKILNADGSLTGFTGRPDIGANVIYTTYPLTGFDGSGNPQWGAGTVIATTPTNNMQDANNFPGNVTLPGYNFVSSHDKVIFFNPSVFYYGTGRPDANPFIWSGYHLSGMNKGGTTWLFKTQLANSRGYNGPYPGPGTFEIGGGVNQYAGNNANIVDDIIVTGWNGEGYHGGQANFYNVYHDDGLAIGQFGTSTFKETGNPNIYPLPGPYISGNARNPSLVKDPATGKLYNVHGDESYSGGIPIDEISRLNTIHEYYSTGTNIAPVANAGSDQAMTLPTSMVTVNGGGTDADGTIVAFAWTKVSGPAAGTITSPSSASTTITGLSLAGTYVYRLTVTDNGGSSNSDLVNIVVSPVVSTVINVGTGSGDIYYVNSGAVQPGYTICIAPGTYGQISFDGLVGTSANPITITNCGGVVTMTNNSLYCFRVVNSQYVHVTGTGGGGTYGFVATQPNPAIHCGSGVNFKENTSDYEVDHFDFYNVENGFLCKIDPQDTTLASYSNGWVIKNISIHDFRVRKTQGEGLYIVNTAATATVKGFSGADSMVEPVKGRNIKVYDFIVDSTGWDGVQVAATDTLQIYNGTVTNYGWKNAGSQQGGILVGGKSQHVSVKNNYIHTGTGNGLQLFGCNYDTLANNILVKVGYDGTGTGQHGIFVDDRPLSGQYTGLGAIILNNTVDSSGNYSIGIFNSNGTMAGSKVYGNIFLQTQSKYFDVQGGAVVDTLNNLNISSHAAIQFMAPNNYHIQYSSPARGKVYVNAGIYNIQKDYDGYNRSYPYSAGALENTNPVPDIPVVKDFFLIIGKIIFR